MGKPSKAAGRAETNDDGAGSARVSSSAGTVSMSAASKRASKKQAKAAEKAARDADKAAQSATKQAAHAAATRSKQHRAEAKASRKAASASQKASEAAAKASAAAAKAATTKPARLVTKLTDPKLAKRAMTIGKIVAPVLAPVLLKAAAGTRGFLDTRRAHTLGVPVDQVAAYRGPTGAVGARIAGLTDAIAELRSRTGNDLQVTRFTEVASTRLQDLTAAVQACASMPKPRRGEVLRAVGRELDGIDADLVTHLMTPRRR